MTFVEEARRWRDEDPDPETRAELDQLVSAGDEAQLADRFARRLEFGTAGLRGAMGAGPNRMNVATVRYAAAGLARYLRSTVTDAPTVVIGFDARHRSDTFAAESARVLAAAGVRARVLPRPLPTPILAFAVRHLRTDAGVMVTASHNPAADNGYKVYAANGAQIVPPTDRLIADAIAAHSSLTQIDIAAADDPAIDHLGDDVVEAYLEAAAAIVPADAPRSVRAVYTPMHGVGGEVFTELVRRAGFPSLHPVAAQMRPDPDFPTVVFPNPEEPGALDLALAEAKAHTADLIVANDPDADRLAIALPAGDGTYRRLTGDELGTLLADHLLRTGAGADGRPPLVATTVVSSRLLRAIAVESGAAYAETLTGFKWLMQPAIARPDLRSVLAYEEALGYAVGELVRDKDGLTAGLTALAIAAGGSIAERLDDLARRHGVHATAQLSLRDDAPGGLDRMRALVGALRASPPARVGSVAVRRVRDLLVDHDPPDGSIAGPLPATDAIILELDDGARVVVRPSGTEPKLKAYLEVIAPVAGGDVDAARRRAERELAALREGLAPLLEHDRGT